MSPTTSAQPHRRLVVPPHWQDHGDLLQHGPDVKAFQQAVNERIDHLGLARRPLVVDGQAGRQTIAHGRFVAQALGVGLRKGVYGLQPYVQALIEHPEKRTRSQKRRGQHFREDLAAAADVTITGNTVRGGATAGERFAAALMEAAHLYYIGKRVPVFYSQIGVTEFDHGITGERAGERSDCSEFIVAICKACGLPDPCEGGYDPRALHYTGTIWKGGKFVAREQLRAPALILYGNPYTFHHVEGWVGNGDGKTTYAQLDRAGSALRDRTVGHGSPPADYGDIDMVAAPHFVNLPNSKI